MSMSWKSGLAAAAVFTLLAVPSAQAGAIQCEPSNERVAILSSATMCGTGDGNLNSGTGVNAALGTASSWTKEGEVSPGDGSTGVHSDDLLTITLLTGSWGGNSGITGTWNIAPSFWSTYGMAAITMHVGNGNGGPDHFVWLIEQGQTAGTFSYSDLDGRGGGLSNNFLFGAGTPGTTTTTGTPTTTGAPTTTGRTVPEPNIGLLSAVGMLSLVGARLWSHKSKTQKGR